MQYIYSKQFFYIFPKPLKVIISKTSIGTPCEKSAGEMAISINSLLQQNLANKNINIAREDIRESFDQSLVSFKSEINQTSDMQIYPIAVTLTAIWLPEEVQMPYFDIFQHITRNRHCVAHEYEYCYWHNVFMKGKSHINHSPLKQDHWLQYQPSLWGYCNKNFKNG